jgi:hypothetical protein
VNADLRQERAMVGFMEQLAIDLASQTGLARGLVEAISLLSCFFLWFCYFFTNERPDASSSSDLVESRRRNRAWRVGMCLDVGVFVLGAGLVWFGILYLWELDRIGVTGKGKFMFFTLGVMTCGIVVWRNCQLLWSWFRHSAGR